MTTLEVQAAAAGSTAATAREGFEMTMSGWGLSVAFVATLLFIAAAVWQAVLVYRGQHCDGGAMSRASGNASLLLVLATVGFFGGSAVAVLAS